jgi:hypothetical protein
MGLSIVDDHRGEICKTFAKVRSAGEVWLSTAIACRPARCCSG